jgi:Predicted membrane protein
MKKLFKSDLFRETLSYVIVGATATVVSFAFQFLFTAVFMMQYLPSSILSFVVSSPVSFFLNRKFTFKAEKLPLGKTLLRFYIIVIPCFALSYFVLHPVTAWFFSRLGLSWPEQYIIYAEQIVANCIYIVINYLGQKFFTFKKSKDSAEQQPDETPEG